MAVCVSLGLDFVGFPTTQSRVLVLDAENSSEAIVEMIGNILKYLGVDTELPELKIFPLCEAGPKWGSEGNNIDRVIREAQPALTIIDPLTAYFPERRGETHVDAPCLCGSAEGDPGGRHLHSICASFAQGSYRVERDTGSVYR